MEPSPLKKFPSLKRREIGTSQEQWVICEPVRPGSGLPLMIRPAVAGLDLAVWAGSNLPFILTRLHRHGALLFRGFDVQGAEGLDRFIRAVAGEPLPYEERSSPRSRVSGNIYTSTDHPPSERIFLHNEQSYNLVFPLQLFFCCVTPAGRGGETPIADARRIFERIPPRVRERFMDRGYLYVRNFGDRLGLSWQTAFQTADRAVVEAYCQRNAIGFEWRSGDRLRTRQVRRAAGRHPFTGEPVWVNHATFFHVSTLPPAIGRALLEEMGEEELPNNTYYGDGEPIEPEVLSLLREAYCAETVEFPWARGDLLVIDNMLVSHGRATYEGPRHLLAGMASPFRWSDVPLVAPLAPAEPPAD
jgi:alpha-ketoglutarate-dependent taurine dioxygenase